MDSYRQRLEKEVELEKAREARMGIFEAEVVSKKREEIEADKRKVQERREQAVKSMMDVTQESREIVLPYLEAFAFDLKAATEEYFMRR